MHIVLPNTNEPAYALSIYINVTYSPHIQQNKFELFLQHLLMFSVAILKKQQNKIENHYN